MPKTTMFSLAVAFGLGVSAVAAAQAVQPAPPAESAAGPKAASQPAARRGPVIKLGDRNCIRDTGSLIPAKRGQCLQGVFGRSYSAGDLRNTGQPKTADALRMLDPAIH
ncbi:MAG TPA: hypothetical protein VF738_07445 [Rhodanobacter sp.]